MSSTMTRKYREDPNHYFHTKRTSIYNFSARCLALLYVIVVFTWILEVVTFYSPGAGDILGFLEAMNAMQGVFILIIFVIIRKKRTVIASWWHDRGSHNISDGTEMQPMKGRCSEDKEQDEKWWCCGCQDILRISEINVIYIFLFESWSKVMISKFVAFIFYGLLRSRTLFRASVA